MMETKTRTNFGFTTTMQLILYTVSDNMYEPNALLFFLFERLTFIS